VKGFLIGFVSAIVLLIATAAFVIYSGRAPVSAADSQTPLLDWVLRTSYEQALERYAAGIQVPNNLDTEPQLFRGARNFADMCSGCHIAPGAQETPYSMGMKPAPPDLVDLMRQRTPAEAFWVLENGVHFTGMPAIGVSHDDQELWALVEFLQRAKTMEAEDYQRIIEMARAAARPEDDHSHHDHSH
jgi:mono/diheme cytochrome c family protein